LSNSAGNPGATPVQALEADISSIFTAPNVVDNNYAALNLNGVRHLGDALSIQGLAYVRQLNQVIPNGTTAQVPARRCASSAACARVSRRRGASEKKPIFTITCGKGQAARRGL